MILPILTIPSKKLYKKSKEVEKIDQTIIQLSKDMLETKQANFGLGLAAPQVGQLKRMAVIGNEDYTEKDVPKIPNQVLINPEIIQRSNEIESHEEGCLSLPGLAGNIPRNKEIKLKAVQLKFHGDQFKIKRVQFTTSGFFARILQHEIDHLDGILFSDKIEDVKTLKRVPVPYKIVFLGTPEFAVPILEGLIKNHWTISLVITESDKPVGRKQILTPSPIKKIALKHNLLVYQPRQIVDINSSLLNLEPDLFIVAAYGQILPEEILNIPLQGSLCLHPSLLPKYRGPAPIQAIILKNEKETGVTLFKMDAKIDHGPIVATSILETNISRLTTKELSQKLSKVATKLLLDTLAFYLNGKIKPKAQDHKKSTYTHLLKKEDGYIENLKSLTEIERKIRAYYPWPKVWTIIGGKRVIIHKAHLENLKLVLDIVQPEGKNPMKYEDYLKGNPEII